MKWLILVLGLILMAIGFWGCISAPRIWHQSLKNYKNLPKAKQNKLNQPNRTVYYFHYFILFPAFLIGGALLIYMFWLY